MKENQTKVTKQETLAALRHPGELYVIMSAATKMPFVFCDEETYDDEVLLYYRLDDAKNKVKELDDRKYKTGVGKLSENVLLGFYTSLYTMGVNCLAVNAGTDTAINIQLPDLVVRKNQTEDGKKLLENPELHLTALYFMQELRKMSSPEMTDELKEMQEELLAHYQKGTYILAMEENGQLPVLKLKDGSMFLPIFTDILELNKFAKGKKMKVTAVPAEKIPQVLFPEAKGVVINPTGANIQLRIARGKKPAEQ